MKMLYRQLRMRTEKTEKNEQELLNERKAQAIKELNQLDNPECSHLFTFVDSLLNADSIESYVDRIAELQTLQKDISVIRIGRHDKKEYLIAFIKGVEITKQAIAVLNQPFNREKVKQSRSDIADLGNIFQSEMHKAEIDSIDRSLGLYFLATSNMLSIIDEIEPLRDTSQTEQLDSIVRGAFDFENRNKTINRIGYMKQLYAKLRRTIPRNEAGEYDIHLIRWEEIEGIKDELTACRNVE